jgi:hypothetical protein
MESADFEAPANESSHSASVLGSGEYQRRPLKLWRPMERLNQARRPRGFVFSAPTRALYDQWRRSQRW